MRKLRLKTQWLLMLAGLLWCRAAYAWVPADAERLALEYVASADYEKQILDTPDLFSSHLHQMLSQLDPIRDFDKVLKIYMFFGWEATLQEHQSVPQLESMLKQIKERKLHLQYTLIKSGLVFEQTASARNGIPMFEELIREISAFNDNQSLAYAETMFAYHLLQNRRNNEAFAKLVTAKDLLNGIPNPSLLVRVQIDSAFGDALNESSKLEATLAARMDLDRLLTRLGIRSRRAFNLYNTGIFYCKRKQPGDLEKAVEIFQESIQLAESVNSANIAALAHFGISTAALATGRYEEAIVHGNQALAYYDAGGPDDGWRPRILRLLAEANLKAGRHAESLRLIERAEKLLSTSNQSGHNELTFLRYQNAKAQGRWQEATTLLEEYLALYKTLANEWGQQQYQKSAVDLGLKFEEEKNAHLKEQVDLLQKFRWMTILASVLLLLSLAALKAVIRQRKSLQKSRNLMNIAHAQVADQHRQMQIFIDEIPGSLASFDPTLEILTENSSYKALRLGDDHELMQAVIQKVEQFRYISSDFEVSRLDLSTETQIRSYDISLKRYIHQEQSCTLLLMIDVSSRVELEKALEKERIRNINSAKLQGLGELAGGVAHEINNPLAIISGRAEQIEAIVMRLAENKDPDRAKSNILRAARNIQDTVTRISRIIIQLRNFARDSSLDMPEPVTLGPIVDDALVLMNERIQKQSIELTIHDEAKEFQVQAVRQQLIQVLTILIQNAVEASTDCVIKKIVIDIQDADAKTLRISVADYGRGIADREKLFLAFYTTKALGEGMGLGLSTAYGIVKIHGGSIYLASSKSPTRFVIELPKRAEASYEQAG